jgi:hypothetical protein
MMKFLGMWWWEHLTVLQRRGLFSNLI